MYSGPSIGPLARAARPPFRFLNLAPEVRPLVYPLVLIIQDILHWRGADYIIDLLPYLQRFSTSETPDVDAVAERTRVQHLWTHRNFGQLSHITHI